ncbi:hypothetical protein [Streptomyces sp. NBC_00151]|jgi:hypothetical protein|nr:hypothetical protein [Streptomyces sp. NBC_00151]WRZ37396.1 hypothetical protein OG915_04625 [Streptomyces sp. NBC_00151]
MAAELRAEQRKGQRPDLSYPLIVNGLDYLDDVWSAGWPLLPACCPTPAP